MGKQFGAEILPKVLELKKQGYTHQRIGEELGYTKVQIKKLVERYNRKQHKYGGCADTGAICQHEQAAFELRSIRENTDHVRAAGSDVTPRNDFLIGVRR